MRSILLIIIVFGSLPACFARPWIGILMWSWIGYMNPHRFTWGFAQSVPFAQIVGLATLGGLLFTRDRRPLPRTREVWLLVALWAVFVLSTFNAVYPDEAWPQLMKVSKILFMTLVALTLFQEPRKLKALIWVTALSIAFFGFKGGIWVILTGGGNQVLGPEGSFMEGNTEIGLAVNMVLPLLVFVRREATNRWVRHFLLAVLGFSIIAVLGTYSRGALLGLLVVLPLLVLKSRAKLIAVVAALVITVVATAVVPDKWFDRMETIQTYEQDNSAMSRIWAWHVAYQIGLDHPLFGAGFSPFSVAMYRRYVSDVPGMGSDAHNIFLQVLAEHGFVGLGLYAALILATLIRLRWIMRQTRREPAVAWIHHCAQMLEASFAAFLVSGWFLSRSYFDLFYGLIAMVILLHVIVMQWQSARPPAAAEALPDARRPVARVLRAGYVP